MYVGIWAFQAPLWDPSRRGWYLRDAFKLVKEQRGNVTATVEAMRSSMREYERRGRASNEEAPIAPQRATQRERMWGVGKLRHVNWSGEDEASGMVAEHGYRIDLPMGPSVCRRSALTYCGCPTVDVIPVPPARAACVLRHPPVRPPSKRDEKNLSTSGQVRHEDVRAEI